MDSRFWAFLIFVNLAKSAHFYSYSFYDIWSGWTTIEFCGPELVQYFFFSWRGPMGQRAKESWFTISCSYHISIAKCVRHVTKKHCRMATNCLSFLKKFHLSSKMHHQIKVTGGVYRLLTQFECGPFSFVLVMWVLDFRCERWQRRAKLHRNRLGSAVLTPLAGMPLVYRLLVTYHVWMFILSKLLF